MGRTVSFGWNLKAELAWGVGISYVRCTNELSRLAKIKIVRCLLYIVNWVLDDGTYNNQTCFRHIEAMIPTWGKIIRRVILCEADGVLVLEIYAVSVYLLQL